MTTPVQILFIHHSVGRYLIRDGGLRDLLAAQTRLPGVTVELWDHDYNKLGLTDGQGHQLETAFPLPGDDTDPSALARLFAGGDAEAAAARGKMLEFDLIAMKSCYPNSAIRSDADMDALKMVYAGLLGSLSALPGYRFLLLTSPPLAPLRTKGDDGHRARNVADWLVAEADGIPNVRVFDLFDRLAAGRADRHADRLARPYRRLLPVDSHPNVRAGREIGPAVVAKMLDMLAVEGPPGRS